MPRKPRLYRTICSDTASPGYIVHPARLGTCSVVRLAQVVRGTLQGEGAAGLAAGQGQVRTHARTAIRW